MHYNVIIVGAGISGLSFAYECQKAGINYALIESSGRVGGCIKSFVKENEKHASVELGAHTFYNSYKHCINLIEELGLDIVKKPKNKLYIKTDNPSVPAEPLLKRLNIVSATYHMLSYAISRLWSKESNSTETLENKITCLLGKNNFHNVISPALQALYNQSVGSLPNTVLFKKRERKTVKDYPKKFFIKGGNETLTKKISEGLNIELNSPLKHVEFNNGVFECLTDKKYTCDYLVFAIPGDKLAKYESVVSTSSSSLSVDFTSQVFNNLEALPPSITVFKDKNKFSEIVFPAAPNLKVRHSSNTENSEESIFSKFNELPNLKNLNHISAKTENVFLIGNYFSGLSVEDCIRHSQSVFQQLSKKLRC